MNTHSHLRLSGSHKGSSVIDGFQHGGEFVSHKDRDNCRRRLVRSQSVIVSCGCHGYTHQILIIIDRLDNSHQKYQELGILRRCSAGIQKVLARIGDNGPVVMLAGSVNSLERLLVKQACIMMLVRHLLHDLHRQLVVIHRDVGSFKYRCQLMLRGRNLVVLCLRRNAELPELLFQIMHVFGYLRFQNAEIVILHLLPLRCRSSDQGASAHQEILSLKVHILVDQEILLLGTNCGVNMCNLLISEKMKNLDRLLGQSLHGTQKRGFLVQSFSAKGTEGRRNIERSVLNECR